MEKDKDIRVGIIGAMEVETELLRSRMMQDNKDDKGVKVSEKAGMTFYEGQIGGISTVLVRSGVGKVNAAACTQILADVYGVTHIINTGVAGSLNNAANIGDIVISACAMHHDVDASVFGYAKGEVPQMGIKAFPADPWLVRQAADACRKAAPDISVFEGMVLSGDQFISERAKKNLIADTFGGMCVEMEGAAIAQTAYINKIPFVIIRAISDKADESVQVSYDEFEGKAARHCAALVINLLENLEA
ncbi:MAG: 5'-methylthioadenosine/adenosylhomocysteine nucleosidase [Lachnospiraceae bacterium]|nr:5'-methylthioadenosine/adenosylhomocysteine nucleosidase [Lachnospiraceae bacterium]